MRGFLLGISVSVAFIAGTAWDSQLLSNARAASPPEVLRWTYRCTTETRGADLVNLARKWGKQGWEMVGCGSVFAAGHFLYFKRPLD